MGPKKKSPYQGKLNEWLPETRPAQSAFEVAESLSTTFGRIWFAELNDRLKLLFGHYGISTDDQDGWRKLALALAHEHIKGFQHKTAGRPKSLHTPESKAARQELLELVRSRVKGDFDGNVKRVCTWLAKNQENLPSFYHGKAFGIDKLRKDVWRAFNDERMDTLFNYTAYSNMVLAADPKAYSVSPLNLSPKATDDEGQK